MNEGVQGVEIARCEDEGEDKERARLALTGAAKQGICHRDANTQRATHDLRQIACDAVIAVGVTPEVIYG